MASLIVGGIYLAHKGATGAYREKQRRKNYERWEGLRDEYDAQKKITRETRSLDIQRTGTDEFGHDDRPIVSLRDLQEANDARTGWRPQESWESSTYNSPQVQPQPGAQHTTQPSYAPQFDAQGRSVSVPSAYWQGRGELRPQKTGATWDDGLPAPLRVTRRSMDEDDYKPYKTTRASSLQHETFQTDSSTRSNQSSYRNSPQIQPVIPDEPIAMDAAFIQQLTGAPAMTQSAPAPMQSQFMDSLKSPMTTVYAAPASQSYQNSAPGGRMAELIERGY